MSQFQPKDVVPRIAGVAFVIAVVLFAVGYVFHSIGCGRYPLSVGLNSRLPVQVVGYSTYFSPEEALFAASNGDVGAAWEPATLVNGRFVARVPCSSWCDGFGFEWSYTQASHLAVRCEYVDGTTEFKVAEIPSGRASREITISLP